MVMTTKNMKPAVPIKFKPYAPENKFLSRDEYIRRNQMRAEKEAALKLAEAEIEKELEAKYAQPEQPNIPEAQDDVQPQVPKNIETVATPEKKKAGRPKKID